MRCSTQDNIVFFEIGSKPLADKGLLPRKPSDIDWLGPLEHVEAALTSRFPLGYALHSIVEGNLPKHIYKCNLPGGKHVMLEVEDSEASGTSQAIYGNMLFEACSYAEHPSGVTILPASFDWLLFFKESHKFKKDSPHFLKTLNDIQLLRSLGAQIPNSVLLSQREKQTYTNKLPNLNTTSKEFFDYRSVPYKYVHDDIHEAIALYDKPAYLYYKPQENEVACSKDLFFAQPENIRLAGVYEESCVLALERSLVPGNFKTHPDKAFTMAREKVCTSITSGWFREYAYRNYYNVLSFYYKSGGSQYVRRFQKALDSGTISLFNQQEVINNV